MALRIQHFWLIALPLSVLYAVYVGHILPGSFGGGTFFGNDGYMRMVRVQKLYESGEWFDAINDRDNAPYGVRSHWTRPFDVVLLAGAAVLQPFLGFEKALYWWGVVVTPFLFVASMLTLLWATAPLFKDNTRRILLILGVMAQPSMANLAQTARPDHHTFIVIAFLGMIGMILRLLVAKRPSRYGTFAGLMIGFGLWLTVELLIGLTAIFSTLSMLWLLRREGIAQKAAYCCLGLFVMLLVALAIERNVGDWGLAEFDKISSVQLLVAFLAMVFWGIVCLLERDPRFSGNIVRRAAILGFGALSALAILLGVYPEALHWPLQTQDELVNRLYWERIAEIKPRWPKDFNSLLGFLQNFGQLLFVGPFLAYALVRERDTPSWDGWLFLAIILLIFVPVGIAMHRFTYFPQLMILICLAELLGRLVERLENEKNVLLRVSARVGALFFGLVGFVLLKFFLVAPAESYAKASSRNLACDDHAILEQLETTYPKNDQRPIVIAHPDYGSRIMYFTDFSVVGSAYHPNVEGIRDSLSFFLAKDDRESREIATRRGVAFVFVCRTYEYKLYTTEDGSLLFERLLDDSPPDWLRLIAPLSETEANHRVYEVLP
ncbi:MAG: hypothetical protein AAF495_18085 [Pseudomonadota bacterium]